MLLLNPGPVTLSERVRRSLLQPDLCHREPEYFDLQDEARQRLLAAYALDGARWAPVLMTGSGTAGVEAMISSLLPDDGRLLVIENGVYGQRITSIAARYGIAHDRLTHAWAAPIDAARLRARLAAQPRITHVAVVHHETTTGRLNDLPAVARACRDEGVALLVDAVSSFGAETIDFDGWQPAAVAATANKCLHGVPGACFVIARRDALQASRPRTLYLDLAAWCRAQDARGTPFTPSVQAYYALVEALREFADEGGVAARHQRYRALAERVAQGLLALGIRPVIDPAEASVVLRAYGLPPGLDYATLHDGLKQQGFIIYAGQGAYDNKMFRISTMGALTEADIDRLLHGVRDILNAGAKTPGG